MDELMISGKRYISSRRAAKEFQYHADYIGQLIRAGKLQGQKVGRIWYVSAASLEEQFSKETSAHVTTKNETAPAAHSDVSSPIAVPPVTPTPVPAPPLSAAGAPLPRPAEPEHEDSKLEEPLMPESKRELKMLTYLSDDAKDADESLVPLAKEKNPSVSTELHSATADEVRSPSSDVHPEPVSEANEEESIPIPLRVTSKIPEPINLAASESNSDRYYPYTRRDDVPNIPVAHIPHHRRRVIGVLVLVVLAALALGGGFFLSTLPQIHTVLINYQ